MKTPLTKRLQALLLTLALLLSLAPTVFAQTGAPGNSTAKPNPFKDVSKDSFYYKAVLWAYYHTPRITSGTSKTKFSPDKTCTREQVVTYLWKAFNEPAPNSTSNPFRKDVDPEAYYYQAVLWAKDNGVTGGVGKNKFGVGQGCTREQVVTFLWKAFGSPEPQTTQNPFPKDVKPDEYYYKAVLWAKENGVTSGIGKNKFGVGTTCTRGQIVTFLYAACYTYDGYVSELDDDGNYVRDDDEARYEDIFADFAALMEQARNAPTTEERFLLYAQAEAALLDTAAVIPTTAQGGQYAMSRVAPRTTPYVKWGSDANRLSDLVVAEDLLTREERSALTAQWEAALAGNGTYDPAAYLEAQGHDLLNYYSAGFNAGPSTLDWSDTYSSNDLSFLVNLVDGLVQFDNLGDLRPALAESWEVSEDGLTYTFHIRHGVKWYTADGAEYAELTAGDFVAGFHHALDCRTGLEYLAGWYGADIAGVDDYIDLNGSFDDVGCKATDDYTLVFTLNRPVSFFLSLLTYNIFLPICDEFYQSKGGVYGIEAYDIASGSISYGSSDDLSSQVYCGAFLPEKLEDYDEIVFVKNANWYREEDVIVQSIQWIWGYSYEDVIDGTVAGTTLTFDMLDQAQADGHFDSCAYVTDTTATSYFGGLNLNRGTFALENGACASPKTEQEKADAATALNNKYFRKALQHAFDKAAWNAVTKGEDLCEANLRNMITDPTFVKLENAVTDEQGYTFPAGTFYGEMVQHYCDLLCAGINVSDGVNGWYDPDAAKADLKAAKEELDEVVSWPIQIDLVYFAQSDAQRDQAEAYKTSIETVLGAENVVVNLIAAENSADYYACGYLAASGAAGNYDLFYGSGWGPDFGDPSTYLNSFDRAVDGYMLRIMGLF